MPVAVVAIPAIMIVLLVLAAAILIEFVGRAMGNAIPLPGIDRLIGYAVRAAQAAINAMAGFFAGVVRGIENLINIPVARFRDIFGSIANTLSRFAGYIRYVLFEAIPNIFNQMDALFFRALEYTRNLVVSFYNSAIAVIQNVYADVLWRIGQAVSSLSNAINWVYQTLSNVIAVEIGNVVHYALSLYNAAIGVIEQVQNYLIGVVQSAISSLERYAQDLATWAYNSAFAAAIAWSAQYANEAIGIARRDLDAIIAGEMGGIWNYLLQMVEDAIAAVPSGVDWIENRLTWLQSLSPASIAAALFALAGAISIPLEWVARCGVKLCDSLGGFGDEMDNLDTDIIIAGIIALAVEAAANPRETATITRSLMADPIRSVADGFRDLVKAL